MNLVGVSYRLLFKRRVSRKGSAAMLKRSLLLCGLTFLLVLVSSCLFDPEEKPPGDDTGDPIVELDLTQRWHVLNNIEFAYNNRK